MSPKICDPMVEAYMQQFLGYFLLVMVPKIVQIISEVFYQIYEQYNVVAFLDHLRVVLNKVLPFIPSVEFMYM